MLEPPLEVGEWVKVDSVKRIPGVGTRPNGSIYEGAGLVVGFGERGRSERIPATATLALVQWDDGELSYIHPCWLCRTEPIWDYQI